MAFKWTFMNSDHLEVKHKISILCTTDNNIHSKKNCLIMNVLWITMHYYICQSWYGKLRNYATQAISRQLQIFVTFVINKHIFSIKDDPTLIFDKIIEAYESVYHGSWYFLWKGITIESIITYTDKYQTFQRNFHCIGDFAIWSRIDLHL